MKKLVSLFLVVTLIGVALWIALGKGPPRPRHVVLVSIDTLRADHLGSYGYSNIRTPNIDRLAREAVLFESAATTTPLTLPAHASLFTGRLPSGHGVIDNFGYRLSPEDETLAELLEKADFATGGFIGSFVLDSRWGISQGFETYFDDFEAPSASRIPLSSHQRRGDEVLASALDWIERQSKDRRLFLFLHFFDPHTPYDPPPPYRDAYGEDDTGRYDGEIAFVDGLIGALRTELEARELYDETVFVLLGDHGEALGEHGEETHGLFLYDATVRIPLIMRAPGMAEGKQVRSQVQIIDVMPTILELLGLDAPDAVDGRSLRLFLEEDDLAEERLAYVESHYARLHFGWAPLRALRSEKLKFIDAPRPELYDLRSDPGETENLAGERTETLSRLRDELAQRRAQGSPSRSRAEALDTETEARLRALGYITATAPAASAEEETLADPKDKIDVFNDFAEANIAGLLGETKRARELLASVIDRDPGATVAYLMLGNLYLREKAFADAATVFRSLLALEETNVDGVYGLALAYKGQHALREAAAGFERCLELQPKQVRALFQLADVRLKQGRAADTEALLRNTPAELWEPSLALVLADALLIQAKRREALDVLREAEQKEPRNVAVKLGVGNMLMEQGDVASALAYYEQARTLDPSSSEAWNALGGGLARQGRTDEALAAFQRAAELDPGFAAAQNNLGIALAQAGKPAQAESAFKRALESDPFYAEAYNNLGFLYLQLGERSHAVPLFRRALALEPDYAQARRNLEEALGRRP